MSEHHAPGADAPDLVETLVYLGCAGAVGGVLYAVAGSSTAHVPDSFVGTLAWLVSPIAALVLIVPRIPERLRGWLVVGISSLSVMTLSAYLLRRTPLSLGGASQDAGFIIEQLVKGKLYLLPHDGTYAGLSPFYPPLFTQVLGKLAALFDLEAPATWKPAALAMAVIAPALAFAAWAGLVGRTAAAAIVALSAFPDPTLHLQKTHEWLSLVLFLPWWLRYVRPGHPPGARAPGRGAWLVGSLIGALLAMTFYYYFLIGSLVLLLGALPRLAQRRAPLTAASVRVLCGAIVLSAGYWLPLLYDCVTIDFKPLQQRWFWGYMNAFPLGFSWSPGDLMLLLGLACGLIVPRLPMVVRSEDAARCAESLASLAAFSIGCLLWYALGRLAVEWGHPILHVKAVPLLHHTLEAAMVIGVLTVIGLRSQRWQGPVAAVIVLFALSNHLRSYAAIKDTRGYAKAKSHLKHASERSFRAQTGSLELRGKTVLAADVRPLKYGAAFSFLGLGAHYAHPAAQFAQRYAFLRSLVTLDESHDVCVLLRHNRFGPVDYLWWQDGKPLVVYLDNFPRGVRSGHFAWPGAGKHGPCLPTLASRGAMKQWQRVLDPGPAAAVQLSAAAHEIAIRYGDAWLRRLSNR